MKDDNLTNIPGLPEIPEQLADVNSMNAGGVSPVDYIYNSIKSKAQPTMLENIDGVSDKADYFSSIFNAAEPRKLSFNEESINIDEAYTKLSDGSYITRYDEGFIKGADNEQLYAEGQSKVSKWTNGLTKFVGKTINNVVGGTLGTAWGAVSAIAEGNWERIYDNDFYDFLDDQNTKMDNLLANYRTQEERDMGFFESATTANFWADDFLGGLSFMTGTVVSESLWAAATGGASLATTASRVGLRGSKYFNTAKNLSKGVKEAQKTAKQYNRLSSIKKATDLSTKYGKAGEVLNLARFTYTGAGFEAGMEARLYEKEQRDNFYREFENLNGRKPNSTEIAEFENTLNKTTNTLWATNMALVGTSNFAILGKTFGITSPFKLPKSNLNKMIFGVGERTTVGEAGQRLASEAIKRTKLQKGLGFSRALLTNPFYEGFVEEGGQAAASSAMENYLTSRYNPSEDALTMAESIYEGLSHTYGTKEGWKEIGLGALIGLIGGEGSNVISGQGLFTEAREALQDQDATSVEKASNLTENTGTNLVNKIYATKLMDNVKHSTEIQATQSQIEDAENRGDLMALSNAQSSLMLTSVKHAVEYDYLEDQIKDFETSLRMQDPEVLAEHYGIETSAVDGKIDELVSEYKELGNEYNSAKNFANYIISDNPKELYEDATDIDVREAKQAIAYQLVMTNKMKQNMDGAFDALNDLVSELNPQLSAEFSSALQRYNQLNKSRKEDVKDLDVAEKRLSKKQQQLEALNRSLLKMNQPKAKADEAGNQRDSDKYNKISNKITELEEEIETLSLDIADKRTKLDNERNQMSNLNASTRAMAAQLDAIDPLVGDDLVDGITIEDTMKTLDKLEQEISKVSKVNPMLVEQITKLSNEYNKGLNAWRRNAETVELLADPDLGLKRVGTFIQKKKTAGKTTLDLLNKLNQVSQEEKNFVSELKSQMDKAEDVLPEDSNTVTEESEQTKAENNLGEDILEEDTQELTSDEKIIKNLENKLKELVGKNSFLLENFSNDAQSLATEKAPTQEEIDEYNSIRDKFVSGDINKLVGRPLDQIGDSVKKRSGLSDNEIVRYQDLSQKLLDWRVVTGTNEDGISVQDILNQIEAYKEDVQSTDLQPTAEQVLEMSDKGKTEFALDIANPDFVNSMDKVNINQNDVETIISHLSLDTIKEQFETEFIKEVNRGTEDNPDLADLYRLTKNGVTLDIMYTQDSHRTIINKNNSDLFLEGMGMQTVKYNNKTGWGYVFKDGVPMESDFGINLITNPEVSILNAQEIYKLAPGKRVNFSISLNDKYNQDVILPLIEEGKEDQARRLMSVYITNDNSDVIGFLKSGAKATGSNFNKVRDAAFSMLKNKINDSNLSLEDLANDNSKDLFNLPYQVEVEKIFIGTPNIELNSDGTPKVFKIDQNKSDLIVGYGLAEKGKINEDSSVRKTFIPKDKNTPYVVIKHGETNVAFPVGLLKSDSNLRDQVRDIANSAKREQDKLVDIIRLLRQNNIDTSSFNLEDLSDINNVIESLPESSSTYTKDDISKMSKEEFLNLTEILINLDKPAFVSPKVKISLSKNLIDTNTNESSKSKGMTLEDKQNMIVKYSNKLSKAKNEAEVLVAVMETADESFISEYINNKDFKKKVNDFALNNSAVPSINTEYTIESLIQDVIDLDSDLIPLDIKQQFEQEVADLKNNPTRSNIKALGRKILKATKDRYKIINNIVNTNNVYHIPTTESREQMFDQNFVKLSGDFYKKINNKYNVTQLKEGLYNKYKNNTLPSHMKFEDNLIKDDFIEELPDTLIDIYEMYYNTIPDIIPSKKAAVVGNDTYLREEFKGDFAAFIQDQYDQGTELYKNVLKHFQITDKGIIKDDLLSREMLDKYQKELGDNYKYLLDYSLINKHIDLQETPQSVIFVGDVETINRLNAVNNPNLPKPKAKAEIINDSTISFSKTNKPFIQYENSVYEQVHSNKQGDFIYKILSPIDPNFIITEVSAPFLKETVDNNKEVNNSKLEINETEGGKIDC